MSRLQFTTAAGHHGGCARQTRPMRSRRPPCRRQQGVGSRRSTKDSRKGSLPDPRNAAQRGSAKSAPHEARDHAARLIRAVVSKG